MTRIRTIVSLAAVFVLSLGLVGTALADRSESERGQKAERAAARQQNKPEKDAKSRAMHGYVISTSDTSFKLDLRDVETDTADDVTVLVTADTQFRISGGKHLAALLSGPQELLAGDRVLVRGAWTDRANLEFTAEVVALTGKTLERFGGTVTAVSSDSITVQKEKGGEAITTTFSLSGAVKLPADATLEVNEKVRVLYRADTTTALAVIDKADLKEAKAERNGNKKDKDEKEKKDRKDKKDRDDD